MNETLDEVARKLGAQKVGKEYKLICPCHDDHTPSAYLTISKKGNVIANCYVCQDWEKVTKQLGLWHERPKAEKSSDSGKARRLDQNITALYDYRSKDGELLYQAIRYEEPGTSKTFAQRSPDGEGGWNFSTKGIRPVPYRLPELLAAPADAWVFIVEGEKDVNNLVAQGLVATCNVGGANKWRKEYNEHFKGRKVAILPDNDDPGRNHAQTVADSLHGIADAVRIVELPDLLPKGDVSDWLAAGWNANNLLGLVETGKEFVPSQKKGEKDDKSLAPTVSEQIEIFARDLGTLALCDLDDRLYLNGAPARDVDLAPLEMAVHDYNGTAGKGEVRIPIGAIETQILIIAKRNRFHPIRDWLNSLQWDNKPHVKTLSEFFADAHPPIREKNRVYSVFECLLSLWLIGAIDRVMNGAQNPVLVLAGPQGIGKSFLPWWLSKPVAEHNGHSARNNPFFCEGNINPESIEHQRRLVSKFIWEIGEVGSTMRKADQDVLKQFITESSATFRVPYAKYEISKPAMCSWIATVNPSVGFLNDPTGNRRFRTVELKAIDWNYSTVIDSVQVWAQAMSWWRAGATSDLSATEKNTINEINKDHSKTSDELESIMQRYEFDPAQTDWFIYTADVVEDLINNVAACRTTNITRVGTALAQLTGTASKRLKGDGFDGRSGYIGVRKSPEIQSEHRLNWMHGKWS